MFRISLPHTNRQSTRHSPENGFLRHKKNSRTDCREKCLLRRCEYRRSNNLCHVNDGTCGCGHADKIGMSNAGHAAMFHPYQCQAEVGSTGGSAEQQ